uniref:Mothers against decapentaplegic homolog n=1 Tax=Sycon ciliatum TaxID=27933 RepID=A0A077SP58_9METZ|nr:Smad 6/7A SciSmad6/7A [Sycon ciliatum]|eukprot:scpid42956/ scgid7330/ Mothers against decapentaplegic homolog 6; Mad homolog 7; SMAD family member 6
MLSLKKGSLIRDLWDQRSSECTPEQRQWQEAAHKSWKALLKSRDGREVKDYVSSLRNGDVERHCWLVSQEDSVVAGQQMSPQLLCARAFRWPDLESTAELHRLDQEAAVCPSGGDSSAGRSDGLVCCSPYHFARVIPTEEEPLRPGGDGRTLWNTERTTLPDHHGRRAVQTVALPSSGGASGDSAISVSVSDLGASLTADSAEYSSLTTDSRSSGARSRRSCSRDTPVITRSVSSSPWMMVRYGEFNTRVGRIEQVSAARMEVFYRGDDESAMPTPDPSSVYALNLRTIRNRDRARGVEDRQRKVGRGFLLWRKSFQAVYLYNRSQYSVYVQSPTLSQPGGQQKVHKIQSGRSFKIFDRARANQVRRWYERNEGGVPRTLDLQYCRISLTSSWGHENPRHPTLFDCHCWFEVHFTFPQESS